MLPALILFIITYALMMIFEKYRPYIALVSGIVFIASGMLPLSKIWGALDFNVLLMIAGTMGLVSMFIKSGMPALLADRILHRVPNVMWATVALSLFAGIISAFVDNVATVLMIAPVALEICRRLKTDPVPVIIAIAVSSNLQGAATLVGDTTAIMLGSAMDMSFTDFFFYGGKIGIFFAVQLGALTSLAVLMIIFRKQTAQIERSGPSVIVNDLFPTFLLLAMLGLLIGASFIPDKPQITNGAICCVLLVIGMVRDLFKTKSMLAVTEPIKAIDFNTLGILVGLFLVIGGIDHCGVIAKAAELLAQAGADNIFVLYTVIVWASVLISAFVDNIPYVATMIPVIMQLSSALGVDPTPLLFGLLTGATLGGNCTPIGASANITGIGILRKAGYKVKSRDFFRIGIPFTLAAVIPAYIFIWLVYGI